MAKPSALLRKLMADRLIEPRDLVRLTGLSRPTVDRHVSGRIEPSLDQREKYALAFKMTADEFETAWQAMPDREMICFTPPASQHQQLRALVVGGETPADVAARLVAEGLKQRPLLAGKEPGLRSAAKSANPRGGRRAN